MTTDKLPEWPEPPFRNTMDARYFEDWSDYYQCNAAAALARMEALVERIVNDRARHYHNCLKPDPAGGPDPVVGNCVCGLSELLAACERRKP